MRDRFKEKKTKDEVVGEENPSLTNFLNDVVKDFTDETESYIDLSAEKLGYHLVSRSQFRGYVKGSVITNVEEIKAIEACHESGMVHKVLDLKG